MSQPRESLEPAPVDGAAGEPVPDLDRMLAASDHTLYDLVRLLADGRHRPQLLQLLTGSSDWLIAKQRRLGGNLPFLADLTIALSGFQDPLDADEVLGLVRLHAVRSVVHGRAAERSGKRSSPLAPGDPIDDALDAALVLADPADRFRALKSLWATLRSLPDTPADRHAVLLDAAREAAEAIPGGFPAGQDRANALAWVIDELLELGERDAARGALGAMERIIGDREASAKKVTLAYTAAGELDKALALIPEIRNVWRGRKARSELARQLWRRRRREDARQLATTAGSHFESAEVLTTLAVEAGGTPASADGSSPKRCGTPARSTGSPKAMGAPGT